MSDAALETAAGQMKENRPRAERRRDVAKIVRDARERLLLAADQQSANDQDLFASLAGKALASSKIMGLFFTLVALIGARWIALDALALWLAAVLIAHFLKMAAAKRFLHSSPQESSLSSWRRQWTFYEFIHHTAFAALFLLPSSGEAPPAIFYALALFLQLVALALVSNTLPFALAAGLAPMTTAAAWHFAFNIDTVTRPLAVFIVMGAFLTLALALHAKETAARLAESKAEKNALLADLEQVRAIAAENQRRAEEAALAKSRFLASISHELRTPLNAILGFAEVMQSEVFGAIGNRHYKDYIANIHSSGLHLLGIIDDILDVSHMETRSYTLTEGSVLLKKVIANSHELMHLKAKAKKITIHEVIDENLPPLRADERALRQIVLNLLSNAVKFTPMGGEIVIALWATPQGGQALSIRDNGPGIPEEEIPLVLAAFRQGSDAIKAAEPGTGLGLSIVQSLVTMHGGRFELRSRQGSGTEVVAFFPPERVIGWKEEASELDKEESARLWA